MKNKYNPLEFVIDFNKLNKLAQETKLLKNVKFIADVREFNEKEKVKVKKYFGGPVNALYDSRTQEMFLPQKFNSSNYSRTMHEIVHSFDPLIVKDDLYPAFEKQFLKNYQELKFKLPDVPDRNQGNNNNDVKIITEFLVKSLIFR